MSIKCPNCSELLSSDSGALRFCSNCGSPLGDSVASSKTELETDQNLVPTIPPSGGDRLTAGFDDTMARNFTRDDAKTPSDTLPTGSHVGPYRIIRKLGHGGMGTVYEAEHSETGQTVALKLLSRSLRTTKETIQRFQRESQIAASINHPRSTFVYQAGQHEGQFYITMELMTGGTLTDVVREEGAIPVDRAVDYVLDMISGLSAAHQSGIVHRDLKPSNCFVDQSGRVKIGDFGLAKSFLADSNLTQTGAFMGTPQYAAPEQLRASEVDERADIYAIGGTLFFLLTGRVPFLGDAAQVIASIVADQPPRVDSLADHVPRELSRVIQQTLEKDPARRPENVEALRQSLLPFSSRGATSADPGRRMAAFFVDIGVISLLIAFLSQIIGMLFQLWAATGLHQFFFVNIFIVFFVSVGYFAIQESWWGTTIGKWLLGMRVVSDGNRTPGLLSATMRAVMVPGLSYVANSVPVYAMNFSPEALLESDSKIWVVIWLQVFSFLSWIPCLLCFLTARKSNGFRGIHEMISRTSVVRLAGALEYKRPSNVPVTTPVALEPPQSFGAFKAIGQIGRPPDPNSEILLGRDDSLDRDVWIVKNASAKPASSWEARKAISRPTRLWVIAENGIVADGTSDGDRWVVTEAIKGMPLVDYDQQTPSIDWGSYRPLLRELAFELAKGQEDGSIPEQLNLQSVWVDQAGRARLLDQPIMPLKSDEDLNQTPVTWLTPFELTTSLLDEFIQNQVVPAHVLTFREELDEFRDEPDALKRAGQRLSELAEEPSAWRWDDRLGVMAISIGIEFSTAISLIMIFVLVLAFFMKMAVLPIAGFTFGIGSLIAICMGAAFAGGPVFRVSGVLVRKNKSLEPASPIRCAFRNWIAWLPLIIISTCLAVVVQQEMLSEAQADLNDSQSVLMIGCLLASLPVALLWVAGAAYSILRPSRGPADLIAGTRLIRK